MNEWMNEWKRMKSKERQIKFKEIISHIYIYMLHGIILKIEIVFVRK